MGGNVRAAALKNKGGVENEKNNHDNSGFSLGLISSGFKVQMLQKGFILQP